MTKVQKADLRRSEIREKLAALNGADVPDLAEVRAASKALTEAEREYRAAVQAQAEARPAFDDGEGVELRRLEGRANLGRYLQAAALSDGRVDGAELELRQALNLRDGEIPLSAFAPQARAATVPAANDQAQAMRPTLDRIFARSDLASLGVRMESVPSGQPVYPVVTAGSAAGFLAEGVAAADDTITISTTKISPSRLTVSSSWSVEDVAAFAEVEAVLRRDLSKAMSDKLDDAVLTGDGTGANLTGMFVTAAGLAAPTGNFEASAENTFDTYATQFAEGIDGLNAYGLGDLQALIGVDTLKHMEGKWRANGEVSAASYMGQRLAGLRASKRVPAVAASKQEALVSRMHGAAVLATWAGVTSVRDPYTDARKGGIRLTFCALYGFEIVRADGWLRMSFHLG